MAEWGKYLKNAVANVEQQLDKVLLDEKSSVRLKEPKTPVSSPLPAQNSSQEPTSSTEQNAASEIANQFRTLTASNFADTPDLTKVLQRARKLTLAVHTDEALEVLDGLEQAKSAVDAYVDSCNEKLTSANSKVLELCRLMHSEESKPSNSTETEQKLALVIEEGQVLAGEELKLNLTIRKLRSEKQAALAKAALLSEKNEEIRQLNTRVSELLTARTDLQALVEHYRDMANAGMASAAHADNASSMDDPAASEEAHAREKQQWHASESALLSRIADLESLSDARAESANELRSLLHEQQHTLAKSRDEVTALQDELRLVRAGAAARENELKELKELNFNLNSSEYNSDSKRSHKNVDRTSTPLDASPSSSPVPPSPSVSSYVPSVSTNPQLASVSSMDQITFSPSASKLRFDPINAFSALSTESLDIPPIEPLESLESDTRLTVGPEMPDIPEIPDVLEIQDIPDIPDDIPGIPEVPEVPEIPGTPGTPGLLGASEQQRPSLLDRSMTRDSLASADGSLLLSGGFSERRLSESVANDENNRLQPRFVHKLALKIRRLETELSNAKRQVDIANAQNDAAQTSLVKMMDAEDQLQVMQNRYEETEKLAEQLKLEVAQLKTAVERKSEIIAELQADVEDVKDAYKQQILDLVAEIERLKNC